MQSRKSIPNVGRRAQGRKALFMLKGSGVSYPSCGDPAEVAGRGPLKHGSLTLEGVASSGELGESPATYDESVLNQPSHPYNRIIQRILLRHKVAERKEFHRILRSEGDYTYQQTTQASSAPPSTRNNPTHSPAFSHSPSRSPPWKPHAQDDYPQPSKAAGEEAAEHSASRLQWADILQAKHCASHEDPLDLQSYTLSSPEDQSVSSLDLAKGYLTDRGLISDPRSQDIYRVVQESSLDTTRSEPSAFSSLPRLNRKRDLQPLDDVLDYFWVYQGMSRQLLDRHSPSYLWNKEWFQKKPTRLPPLYIATGQKTQRTSPDRTSSVQFSRVSSEEVDTPEGTPREKNGTNSEHKSQHSRRTLSSELQSSETQAQTDDDDGDDGDADDVDDSSCQTLSPENRCNKGQGRRVTLVVKMPVLTHETSNSDLLDND